MPLEGLLFPVFQTNVVPSKRRVTLTQLHSIRFRKNQILLFRVVSYRIYIKTVQTNHQLDTIPDLTVVEHRPFP